MLTINPFLNKKFNTSNASKFNYKKELFDFIDKKRKDLNLSYRDIAYMFPGNNKSKIINEFMKFQTYGTMNKFYFNELLKILNISSDEIDALNEAQSFFDQQDSQENQQLEGAKRWVDEMMSNYQNGDTGMYDQMKSTMESLGIDEERLKNMSNEEVNQYVQDMCKKFGISQSLFDKLKDKFGR